MPAQAKYTVMIPGDRAVAEAAHHWLHHGPAPIQTAYIDAPKQGLQEEHHVVALGDDSPELDSHIKQLALHVAEHGGHPVIHCTKEGKGGIQSWAISNHKLPNPS